MKKFLFIPKFAVVKYRPIIFYYMVILLFAISSNYSKVCLAELVDKIVAVVNDQSITRWEVEEAMKPVASQIRKIYNGKELEQKLIQARREVLDRLIEEKLILQEAKRQNIEVRNEEVEERLQQAKSKFPNKESFENALRAQGINTWGLKKIYKEQFMAQKMIKQYVRESIKITPTQIADYYKQHIADFRLPKAVGLSQILIKYKMDEESKRTERTAMQVMELLNMGTDFALVAKKYSEGPNASGGGDIGMVEPGTMTSQIDDVIFNMKEGDISKPIKTNVGFAILKINSIRQEKYLPIEETKDKIEELLLDQNAKLIIDKLIEQLREKAFISVEE